MANQPRKLPAIQFYPGDWLRDNVSGCSLAAQGLWLRMMFLGHDSERYGYLSMNGSPMTHDHIARRCGASVDEYETILAELDRAGVPSRTPDGTIYSRRMVRDAENRSKDAKRQSRHRNGVRHADVTTMSQAPSSSVSSSTSKDLSEPPSHSSEPSVRTRSGQGLWIDPGDLKHPEKVLDWLNRNARRLKIDPGNFDVQTRVMGAAVRALEVDGEPGAVFIGIVKEKLWGHLTDAQADRGKRLIAEHHRASGNGLSAALAGMVKGLES